MKNTQPVFMQAAALVTLLWSALPAHAAGIAARPFPLSDVRLHDGPFQHAQDLCHRYLLALDIDRLLAPFRIEAGLEPKAPMYPNWESSGLGGHTAGHYLTAAAQMWVATGDAEMKRRLDGMVKELAECQRAGVGGYVGGIPGSSKLWNGLVASLGEAQGFSLGGAWVPWYNEHKLFAGLRDAWLIGGNVQAREVLIRLSDWCDALTSNLTEEQMQRMLGAEHGGMNEVLADVHSITGDPKYLALARRFSHRAILDPLLLHRDQLTGLHANTQIPKVVGFARIAELGGDASWRDAARFFWNTVVERRSLAFGGNSVREHFNPPDDFSSVLESREGPETCNTYNMLRLTETLFRHEPAAYFADYYERALFNHILSSQHPGHGGLVYFTPIRPQHYRVYSQPETCFWCCVGTGLESHGKYGAFIYAHTDAALFVNLFIASEVEWRERGVCVRQETKFPDVSGSQLTVSTAQPQRFALKVRHPGWCGRPVVSINGEPWRTPSSRSSYIEIAREWHDGDRVEIDLPMRTTVERLPDHSDYVALLHGPIVLAARTDAEELDGLIAGDSRMGHIAPGAHRSMDHAPMLVGDFSSLAENIKPVPGKPLTFTATGLIRPDTFRDLELTPFFRLHDARYMLYWRTASAEKYPEVMAELAASERDRLDLEARTIDAVAPGEQQPEVEHGLTSEKSGSGAVLGRRCRDAAGWFSYKLRTQPGVLQELIVTTYERQRDRACDILVNGQILASIAPKTDLRDRFVDTTYPVPTEIVNAAKDGVLTVTFAAKQDLRTASIFGLRLVRTPAVPLGR
jgi:uncharacterized protein